MTADSGASYPSGHTTAAAVLAVSLVVVAATLAGRSAAFVLGGLYAVAVAGSRVYLADHYPPDVIEHTSGIACGASVYWSSTYGAFCTWGAIGIAYERRGGTAVRLVSGMVLELGGLQGSAGHVETADVYDAAGDRSFTAGSMDGLSGPVTAAVLGDGRVLVVDSAGKTALYKPDGS